MSTPQPTPLAPLTIAEAKQLRALLKQAEAAGQLSLGRITNGIYRATIYRANSLRVELFDTPDGDQIAEIALYHPAITAP